MEIRSLRNIVFLCALCSIQVTSVYSQNTTDVSTAIPPDQTTLSPDTTDAAQTDTAGTDTPQTDTAGADTPQTDSAPTTTEAAVADASTATSNTDTEQQTTVDTTTQTTPTQTDASSDGTAAPGTEETTPGDSTVPSTDGQTGVPDNTTEEPTAQPAVTTGNDTQTTTVIQTNDTVTTESLGGSTPVADNSTSTQVPEGSTASTDGGDNSTESSLTTSAQPSASTSPPTQGSTTQAQPETEYPPVEADTDIATFTLQLKFNEPEVSCNGSYLRDELDKNLKSTGGYRGVKSVDETQLNASYSAKSLVERDSNSVKSELTSALDVSNDCYKFNETGLNDVISEFAAQTRDYCSARYLCPLGYNCREGVEGPVCISVCEGSDCQNGGQCDVVIKQEATAEARCRCVDTIGTVYSGEKCEESRMNPERIAAIVGGVLGGVCLILLIALYCTCYRKRENSGKKYHLSGVYNETYDHASLDMKNM